MNKTVLGAILACAFASPSFGFEPFKVKDIRVEGIQRTEAGTVFSYLPVKVGDVMTDEKAAQAIKALFATGFFKDVRIDVEQGVVIVQVQERPSIAKIEFVGMKEFEKDQILKALKSTGFSESMTFDRSMLERAEQELKKQYLSKGKYDVNIATTVTPLERNRVGIHFNIDEGAASKIKQISIVGANAFKEKDLLALFDLTTPGLFTWFTKNDQYSKQKLSADIEKLRSYYLDRGYLEFNVDSTQVTLSPDKKDVFITLNVTEGPSYTVSNIKLAGDLIIPETEARGLMKTKVGDVFSRELMNASTKAISERLGKEGYAFANVNAVPELDKTKHLAAFTVFVDPGKRVYVRRINITGNTRTADEVIRREMRQVESGIYDVDKVTLSKQRIDKLGYFQEVTVDTPPVAGTADQVDVNINVAEKPTGNIMVGAGFSSTEKLILSGSIAQQNIFGSGKHASVQLNTGKINRVMSFSFTDPYFTVDGISQGFDIYHRTVNPTSLSVGNYKTASTGGGIRWGFPIAEKESLTLGVGADQTKVTTYSDSPKRYLDFVREFGSSNYTMPISAGWASDGKDSFIYPTKGIVQRANVEVATPGGSLKYYRATYSYGQYFPVTKGTTLYMNGELGMANGYGGQGLPFYKNFYAGGIGSLRGYAPAGVGPRDTICDDYTAMTNCRTSDEHLGGTRRILGSSEFLVAMPGYEKHIRLGLFFDVGQVYGNGESIRLSQLRKSTGVSFSWISPVGPLKFSFARPINKSEGDKTEPFQFQLGTTF